MQISVVVIIIISCTVLIVNKMFSELDGKEYEKLQEWEKKTQLISGCQGSRTKGSEFQQKAELRK